MLKVLTPANASGERRYIADVIFKRFLGLEYVLDHHNRPEVLITDGCGKRLLLDDSFFSGLSGDLVQENKVPSTPLEQWISVQGQLPVPPVGPNLPILFGKVLANGTYVALGEKEIRLGLDVLGSAFFMLTRYEELLPCKRDRFDRFPASASIACRAGFLERPIINEYVEILWACLQRLWPMLTRPARQFRVVLSHDVDQPFRELRMSFPQMVKTTAADLLKRKSLAGALKRVFDWTACHTLGPSWDPVYTFGYIMRLVERHGLRSAFYFIPSEKAGPPDYRYGMREPNIQKLIVEIHARGHEIGYHAGLQTYNDSERMSQETDLLRATCEHLGVKQACYGSRQHYLQIQVPLTLRHLSKAGMTYDSTLSYADRPGFRCGTCWEYPFYDLEERRPLGIVERPLVLMECSVTTYMGLGVGSRALEAMLRIAEQCRRFSGDFTLLWHNSELASGQQRSLFENVLSALA